MPIDWSDVASVRTGLASGFDVRAMSADFVHRNAVHEKTLGSLSPDELAGLARLGGNFPNFIGAAAFRFEAEADFALALKMCDALLEVPTDRVALFAVCNALSCLNAAWADDKLGPMPDRANAYLTRWLPLGPKNTPLLPNAAFVCMRLNDHERAIAVLRQAVLLADPTVHRWLAAAAFNPLRGTPAFDALATLKPEYPPALRALQVQLLTSDAVMADAAMAANIEYVHGEL